MIFTQKLILPMLQISANHKHQFKGNDFDPDSNSSLNHRLSILKEFTGARNSVCEKLALVTALFTKPRAPWLPVVPCRTEKMSIDREWELGE